MIGMAILVVLAIVGVIFIFHKIFYFVEYLFLIDSRLEYLEGRFDNMPSTEELAKKILTTKIPISELPADLVKEYSKMTDKDGKIMTPDSDIKKYTG